MMKCCVLRLQVNCVMVLWGNKRHHTEMKYYDIRQFSHVSLTLFNSKLNSESQILKYFHTGSFFQCCAVLKTCCIR